MIVAAHLLLLAPMTAEGGFCWRQVRVNSQMAYPLNCDSPVFMGIAHNPETLLQPNNGRQSRPGYVVLGAAGIAIVERIQRVTGVESIYGQRDPAYPAFIAINFIVVVAAIATTAWIALDLGLSRMAAAAVGSMIAINDVTKAFFWTPHQQMFILLVPVATIVLVRRLLLSAASYRRIAVVGFCIGLVALVYASTLITLVAAVIAILIGPAHRPGHRPGHRRGHRTGAGSRLRPKVGRAVVLMAAFAAPVLAWVQVCQVVAGSFYSHETAVYRQFVWLPEAARQGISPLLDAMAAATKGTVTEIAEGAGPVVLVFAVLAAIILATRTTVDRDQRSVTMAAAFITLGCTVAFCWGLGFFAPRLGTQLVPTLLILSCWAAMRLAEKSTIARRSVTPAFLVLAGTSIGHVLTTAGPYF